MKIREQLTTQRSIRRAQKIPNTDLPLYLDTAVMGLGQALDAWRFHNAPGQEVEQAIDAIAVLWSEVERRGLAKT